jgi:torulene dioxygenase
VATGKTEILAKITGADIKPAYIHSFFLTNDFVVLAIWPAYIAGLSLSILWERNMLDALSKFDPEARTLWLVVDRKHGCGLVAKYSSPAVFCFHSINAWQETAADGTASVFCDLVEFPNLDILHRFYYDNLVSTGPGVCNYAGGNRENIQPSMARYHLANIPTATSKKAAPTTAAEAVITLRIPGPAIGELPTINPHFSTRKARYVYTVVDRGHSSFFDAICKTDLDSRTATVWESPHHTPGEPIFIPAARHADSADSDGEAAEDDGVLLSVVLNGDTGMSYLLCLDASTLQEVGRAECDAAVGFGFHGRFAPSSPSLVV